MVMEMRYIEIGIAWRRRLRAKRGWMNRRMALTSLRRELGVLEVVEATAYDGNVEIEKLRG